MLIFIARVEKAYWSHFFDYRNFENPEVHYLLCLIYNEYRIVTVVMHTSIDKKYNYDNYFSLDMLRIMG